MSEYIIESQTLTDIADAIRGKTGSSSTLTPLEMPNAIANIPSGGKPQFTLIGQSTHVLSEYTDTSTAETIDTNIDVTSDDHASTSRPRPSKTPLPPLKMRGADCT